MPQTVRGEGESGASMAASDSSVGGGVGVGRGVNARESPGHLSGLELWAACGQPRRSGGHPGHPRAPRILNLIRDVTPGLLSASSSDGHGGGKRGEEEKGESSHDTAPARDDVGSHIPVPSASREQIWSETEHMKPDSGPGKAEVQGVSNLKPGEGVEAGRRPDPEGALGVSIASNSRNRQLVEVE